MRVGEYLGRSCCGRRSEHRAALSIIRQGVSAPCWQNDASSTTPKQRRAFCLYTTLGFRARDPLALLQGSPLSAQFEGYLVRPAAEPDFASCNRLCRAVHGFSRDRELADALGRGKAMVVEHFGQVTGYSTGIGFFSHAVARTNMELRALIGAAKAFPGPGFLLSARDHKLFSFCLESGLRLVMQATLLTMGLYQDPDGAWLPSSQY